ncbi:MAG TPA: AAA family ATPase [Bryobacteraceae bacterium]|jgi:ATP-dependent Clp protease ATP-binding subunit ClpA|nr:AAA family ATPase [Bryobacteraceae bacterium]
MKNLAVIKKGISSRIPEGQTGLALLDATVTGTKAKDLETKLQRLVIGQEEAINEIVWTYQTYLAGLSPDGRPIGNFLFLGPTGTGKTRAVEATAEALLGNPRAVIKIDCGEFQHSHEIAKLIGSPPGYLGHRETHALLSQEALNRYHTENMKLTFVLFDEIEKASDALWNLLLGILDKATLTLGDNRKVDFSNALIFMTSNIGASEMSSLVSPKLGFQKLGFQKPGFQNPGFNASTPEDSNCSLTLAAKLSRTGMEAARRKFTPEFLNRLDNVVVFRSLGNEELNRIIDIELERVQQRVQTASAGKPFLINVTGSARKFLLIEGIDLRYGARPLKRAIERLLVNPLSNLMASGQIRQHDKIRVTHNGESPSLTFFRETDARETWKTNGAMAA